MIGSDVTQGTGGTVLHFHAIGGGLEQATFSLENTGTGAAVTAALETLALGNGFSGLSDGNVTLAAGQTSGAYTLTYDTTDGPLVGVLDAGPLRSESD